MVIMFEVLRNILFASRSEAIPLDAETVYVATAHLAKNHWFSTEINLHAMKMSYDKSIVRCFVCVCDFDGFEAWLCRFLLLAWLVAID